MGRKEGRLGGFMKHSMFDSMMDQDSIPYCQWCEEKQSLINELVKALEQITNKPDYTNPEGMVHIARAAIAKAKEEMANDR